VLELPESRVDRDRPLISGGERTLYEVAVAGAVLGLDVELRGHLNGPILDELTESAGAAPRVRLGSRPPARDELIVVPEGSDIELLTAVHLSGARRVMHLLGPPGLYGLSFHRPMYDRHDQHTVPLDAVGRPEEFRAIQSLGFTMWTNAQGIAAAGKRAGVNVEWVGTGTPVPFPTVPAKTFDLAVVTENRWAIWAENAVAMIPGASVLRVGVTDSVYSLAQALGPARILVWPSRVEGASRIAREARSVGTVPVMLDTNPFATRQDHGGGVVLAPNVRVIAEEIKRLLANPARLEKLQRQAAESARVQADWSRFLDRIGAAIAGVVEHPTGLLYQAMGDAIRWRAQSEHPGP
jgi:hypothetical protein